jgi:regulator of protease activity HflC (stomatin/prohibitin superfamily)
VHAVQNFASALHGLASATVRTLVGEMDLERVLGKREALNEALRARLDAVTRNWGIEVTMVHLRDVVRPPEVYEAMSRQLQAEWNRRAALIEAQGRKEVTVLTAEADREAAVRRAEGERQALAIRLGGLAEGLEQLDAVAASFRPQTVALQYLETLKELAASPASKVVVPVEISALLKSSLVESDGVSARG